jgi:4-hydroxyphenylpyruvate dioxygenase
MSNSRLVAANSGTFSAPLPAVIDAVKAAGFDGLEVWHSDIDALPGGAAAAAALLKQAEIQVPTFQLLRNYEGSGIARQERIEFAQTLMDTMETIGARVLLVCANTDTASSGNQAEQLGDLRMLADLAQARNVQIGFEPLAWSRWIYDYEQACACVEAVNHPCFGLVLDVFHLFSQNTNLKILDRISMDKLFMVQLSNAVAMPLPTLEIARHHRRYPADGDWPVATVVQRLEQHGFDGCYSIEVFNDDYKNQDPRDVAQAAFLSFHELFAPEEYAAQEVS